MVAQVGLNSLEKDQVSPILPTISVSLYLYPLIIVTDGQEQNLVVVIVVLFSMNKIKKCIVGSTNQPVNLESCVEVDVVD